MADVIFVAMIIAFFALAALFVVACDRIIGDEAESSDPHAQRRQLCPERTQRLSYDNAVGLMLSDPRHRVPRLRARVPGEALDVCLGLAPARLPDRAARDLDAASSAPTSRRSTATARRRATACFLPVENVIYRACRVDPDREQRWNVYALLAARVQRRLGAHPVRATTAAGSPTAQPRPSVAVCPPALSFNTAMSFLTNTNWQNYSGESTMSYLTQMAGLARPQLRLGGGRRRGCRRTRARARAPALEHARATSGSISSARRRACCCRSRSRSRSCS